MFATPTSTTPKKAIFDECSNMSVGLSLDGRMLYAIEGTKFGQSAKITTYDVSQRNYRSSSLNGLQLRQGQYSKYIEPQDQRVDDSKIYFPSSGSTLTIYNLADHYVELTFDTTLPEYDGDPSDGNIYKLHSRRFPKNAPLKRVGNRLALMTYIDHPAYKKETSQRAIDLSANSTHDFMSLPNGVYDIPLPYESASMNIQSADGEVCIWTKENKYCEEGELLNLYENLNFDYTLLTKYDDKFKLYEIKVNEHLDLQWKSISDLFDEIEFSSDKNVFVLKNENKEIGTYNKNFTYNYIQIPQSNKIKFLHADRDFSKFLLRNESNEILLHMWNDVGKEISMMVCK